MHLFEATPKIYFGHNSLDYLYKLPNEKALVVTDPFMVSSGTIKAVTGRLDKMGMEYSVFSEIEPDPSIETVAAGLQQIFHVKPDIVIALGGGSAIDATKAMLYFCTRFKGVLMDKQYIHYPTFIAIPTTSGTGSEVTSYAVVSDRQRGVKIPLSHRNMIPAVAILDPEFTKTLPPAMIAFTGMDVLTHVIEAYVSRGHNDFTDMCARDAGLKVLGCLPGMFADPGNEPLREKMFTASTMAGLAFTNSGLGLCHGIAHTLGAEFHIPHGKANAIILPYVIAFNSGLDKRGRLGADVGLTLQRYAMFAREMGVTEVDDQKACGRLIRLVAELGKTLDVPSCLAESGVDKSDFIPRIGECAKKILLDACTGANPVKVSEGEVASILEDVYYGALGGVR